MPKKKQQSSIRDIAARNNIFQRQQIQGQVKILRLQWDFLHSQINFLKEQQKLLSDNIEGKLNESQKLAEDFEQYGIDQP